MIQDANWIITGEGKLDNQTLSGKTIAGVLESARKKEIPVAAFCGVIELNMEEQKTSGIDFATSILQNFQTLEEAMNFATGQPIEAFSVVETHCKIQGDDYCRFEIREKVAA